MSTPEPGWDHGSARTVGTANKPVMIGSAAAVEAPVTHVDVGGLVAHRVRHPPHALRVLDEMPQLFPCGQIIGTPKIGVRRIV